ncbi:MAG: hypothetical protein BWX66_00200 [Deltaproteobacteria bacterium ADurb.Bin058]|nr:MAG: hypothetical protein BWX66_00200 [Deltaproteobacteria bacterium ADurb.Bin058]
MTGVVFKVIDIYNKVVWGKKLTLMYGFDFLAKLDKRAGASMKNQAIISTNQVAIDNWNVFWKLVKKLWIVLKAVTNQEGVRLIGV